LEAATRQAQVSTFALKCPVRLAEKPWLKVLKVLLADLL